jgi:ribonuclease HI
MKQFFAVLRLTKLRDLYPEGYFSHIPVEIRMDSKLVIEQLRGNYRVKHPNLIPRYLELSNLIARHFPLITYTHVPREKNKDADALANEAMDKGA